MKSMRVKDGMTVIGFPFSSITKVRWLSKNSAVFKRINRPFKRNWAAIL